MTTLATTPTLTARQADVVRELAAGGTNREAASRLHVSETTFKTHLSRVYDKLGVSDRAAAVRVAYERRLLWGSRAHPPRRRRCALVCAVPCCETGAGARVWQHGVAHGASARSCAARLHVSDMGDRATCQEKVGLYSVPELTGNRNRPTTSISPESTTSPSRASGMPCSVHNSANAA